jgi:NAD-dependent DNA ligase
MENDSKYTSKARHDKAISTLLHALEEIATDQTVTSKEWELLANWVSENQSLADRHPYNELVPPLITAVKDRVLSEEERQDMSWLCTKLRSIEYYSLVSTDMQRLQPILTAIASDGTVAEAEVDQLSMWLLEREHLRKCWPYEEMDSLLTTTMRDQSIDPKEQKLLLEFCSSFATSDLDFETPHITARTLSAIFAVSPVISFDDYSFCFTGESKRATREEMKTLAQDRGAKVVESVSPDLDYLVVGVGGNPCWAYSSYGRKIEKALELRRQGSKLLIVHESDFFNALAR